MESEYKCSRCKSGGIYTTKKERVCRKCGYREKLIIETEQSVDNGKKEEVTSSG